MANVLTHRFTSPKADGADGTQVQPSHWNDGHKFIGGNAGDLLVRDPTDATFGAKWGLSGVRLGAPVGAALALGQYDNFQPANGATAVTWLLTPSVATGITGIVAEPEGTQHLLINTTSFSVTLYNQQPSSLAANRLLGPGFNHYVLGTWGAVWLVYLQGYTSWLIQKA
jgi:hypothetical protein